ncbi:MAG: HAD-IA family hydrolase [Holophagales bacterium]|nr:HAD-IA family hydrolase [Holophagales bacterium]
MRGKSTSKPPPRPPAYPGAPRAVTFDFAGTLANCPRVAEIYSEVLARHGIEASVAALRTHLPQVWHELASIGRPERSRFGLFPNGARGFWHRLLVQLCAVMDLGEPSRFASAELFDRFAHAEAWELYADSRTCLEGLSASGVRLGIISNWDLRLPGLLGELGLHGHFDALVVAEEEGLEKPHPRLFRRCLFLLGVEPAEAVHIGDHGVEDVEGALALGMGARRIDRGTGTVGPHGDALERLLRPWLVEEAESA